MATVARHPVKFCKQAFSQPTHLALEKDRNLRYQHASDMRSDLQRLKRDTESGRNAASAGMAAMHEAPVAQQLRKIVVPASVVVTVLIVSGLYCRAHHTRPLTEKDTIVLTDFTLWKDADPDIPILKEAKAEYTKLQ